MTFPNKAGDHADTDEILREELKAAGIQTIQEAGGRPPEYMAELLRSQSGEVKTSVIGVLHGWTFKRAWYYWIASGPGIEITAAERLQESHGKTVRASGDAGCRGPRFWFKGLACGSYHVDDAEGLKALADTIKGLVDGGNKAESAAEIAALRTELEEARKLLMLALYHHQGGGSPVGQPIRKFFGMDQFSRLTPTQMSEVESVAAIDAAKEPK